MGRVKAGEKEKLGVRGGEKGRVNSGKGRRVRGWENGKGLRVGKWVRLKGEGLRVGKGIGLKVRKMGKG